MPKFFGLETSFQTVFYTNRTSCLRDKIFRKHKTKKRLEMKEFTIQPSFLLIKYIQKFF